MLRALYNEVTRLPLGVIYIYIHMGTSPQSSGAGESWGGRPGLPIPNSLYGLWDVNNTEVVVVVQALHLEVCNPEAQARIHTKKKKEKRKERERARKKKKIRRKMKEKEVKKTTRTTKWNSGRGKLCAVLTRNKDNSGSSVTHHSDVQLTSLHKRYTLLSRSRHDFSLLLLKKNLLVFQCQNQLSRVDFLSAHVHEASQVSTTCEKGVTAWWVS